MLHKISNLDWLFGMGDQIKDGETGGETSTQERNAYKILAGKYGGTKSLVRPRHKWKNKFKMNLKKKVVRVDWINLARDRVQ
jgi:hypothetical protein